MSSAPMPAVAAWTHRDARDGFEVVFLREDAEGLRLDGYVSAVEEDVPWVVRYAVSADPRGVTREARVWSRTPTRSNELAVEADGEGGWAVDGEAAPQLDGCLDVDLEASSCTNALPVRRLALAVGEVAEAPAAYVRVLDGAVERLEQRYLRLEDGPGARYDYIAPRFAFRAELSFDPSGLVVDYPGIAVRAY